MTSKELAGAIRNEELDCNNLQLFFSALIKGLMVDLRKLVSIRGVPVPHMIINTGDDTVWLIEKDYDYRKEPCEVTNEQYIYNIVPRCIVSMGSIDMVPDQLTSPYSTGIFQYEHDDQICSFSAEFRRMPVKVNVTLRYILDSFTDTLEMLQHACTKLAFIRTFKIVYLGQTITCTYKIPEAMEDQHLAEISGDTSDQRDRTVELQLEVESNLPCFSPKTVTEQVYISHPIQKLSINHETTERDFASRSSFRGPGRR